MDNLLLYNKLAMLPDSFKQDVSDFIDKLLLKTEKKTVATDKPAFGSAKGMIIIHPDFDEPLDCFKEYMPNE